MTTTGHTLEIDECCLTLEIKGDLDTMAEIPECEIDAACAALDLRCTWEPLSPTCYRLERAEVRP